MPWMGSVELAPEGFPDSGRGRRGYNMQWKEDGGAAWGGAC
jgi:hypothetical protein